MNTVEERKAIIDAALMGYEIQYRNSKNDPNFWFDLTNEESIELRFNFSFDHVEYRVKPEKKKLWGVLAVFKDECVKHYIEADGVKSTDAYRTGGVEAIIDISQIEYESGEGL